MARTRPTSPPGHFRLRRRYWRYQLVFAAGQLASAFVAVLCMRLAPSVATGLLFVVPGVLAFASVYTYGPPHKTGLVVESDRLIVAGRIIPFAEVRGILHHFHTDRVNGDGSAFSIRHTWTLTLRLLGDARLVIHRTVTDYPDGDYSPRPDAEGRNMANVIKAVHNVWLSAVPRPLRLAQRADLVAYRRYCPVARRWQAPLESPAFSFMTLALAFFGGLSLIMS